MRLVHSVAMLAIATGVVGTIADVNAASPSSDIQIAESKGDTAKGGRAFRPNPTGDGTTEQVKTQRSKPKADGDGTTQHFKTKK